MFSVEKNQYRQADQTVAKCQEHHHVSWAEVLPLESVIQINEHIYEVYQQRIYE